MFITFEGIDGSGKSTLIPFVADWLRQQGREVVCTREPGGTPMGSTLRHLLEFEDVGDKTRFLLYLADRAEHVEKVIKPALAAKQDVLCDRFCDSTMAYQPETFPIVPASFFASGGLMPSLTILLDVSAETAAQRIYKREENPPSEAEFEYLRQVRQRYQEAARLDPRITVIDAERDVDAVYNDVIKAILEAHCFEGA